MINGRHTTIILGFLFLLLLMLVLGLRLIFGGIEQSFLWGSPFGLLLGLVTCLYLYYEWDPVTLSPKNPNTSKASWEKIWWVVPAGLVGSRLLIDWASQTVADYIMGIIFTWLFVTVGYIMFQMWWHR